MINKPGVPRNPYGKSGTGILFFFFLLAHQGLFVDLVDSDKHPISISRMRMEMKIHSGGNGEFMEK